MIIDTTFVLDVWDGDERAIDRLELLERERIQQRFSAVTVFELHHGVVRSNKPESEKRRVLDVLQSKPIVSANERIMAKAGRLHGETINSGRRIGQSDCIIAATAIICDEPVLTRNVDHFDRIDDVEIRSY